MPRHLTFHSERPFNILAAPSDVMDRLHTLQQDLNPSFVIVDTLRKCYSGDEKDGDLPKSVYALWEFLFPNAFILFVHHDKKSQLVEGREIVGGDESFSGHQAWINDVVVAYHLTLQGNRKSKKLKLEMTRSQMCELPDALILQLGNDGVGFTDTLHTSVIDAYHRLSVTTPKMARYQQLAHQFGVSEKTIRNAVATESKSVANSVTPIESTT
jgi:hypothetical protein